MIDVEVDRLCIERGRCKILVNGNYYVVKGVKDGDIVDINGEKVRIIQKEESVISIKLSNENAKNLILGYIIGNYHLKIMVDEKNNVVYIPAELGLDYLLDKFKEYNPKVEKIKFKPNVELPISIVIDFKT
ncbi:hypothetical protein DFR86_04355 [Acidianus sulfidivorans JP7]|uniref:Urease accessory protein UreE n=1 Tax=Acidianus sulfidivorans JP7 TaxID=619593 RepID=A0A2U9ILS5_9CREN|nr:hypothetical protein [Acidianus sulfidivorans]AWR96864.1 hypothetical protein DFR86_04355 [Acidianus sulfidivorans JP7]